MGAFRGTGSKVLVNFREQSGALTGRLFPSGNLADTIKMDDGTTIDVTITDMTNPCVFFKAADFGLGLTELELSNPDGTLTGPPGVQDRLAGLRLRTMFLAYKSRRSMTGSSMAAITRCRSGASTLVAGTSAYIHAARTSANASEPCKVNTSSSRALGRRNHAKLMKAALAATVLRVA